MRVVGAGREVVGAGVGRGEDEAAVVPRAVVIVEGVREQVAVAVVDAVQVGVFQEDGQIRVQAGQVYLVTLLGDEFDREPVLVVRAFDLARGGAADRQHGRGIGCGRVVIGQCLQRQPVAAGVFKVGAGGDVEGVRGGRNKIQKAVVPCPAVIIKGPIDQVPVGVVDAAQGRVPEGALARVGPFEVDPVILSGVLTN